MDTVLILSQESLETPLKIQEKKVASWATSRHKLATKLMNKSTFLDDPKSFLKEEINDETCELYLDMPDFTVQSAAAASTTWLACARGAEE